MLNTPLSQLKPNPAQARKAFGETALRPMAESMQSGGQFQPVGAKLEGTVPGGGESRLRAAGLAGLATLEVVVNDKPLSDSESRVIHATENLHRVDLSDTEVYLGLTELAALKHERFNKEIAMPQLLTKPLWWLKRNGGRSFSGKTSVGTERPAGIAGNLVIRVGLAIILLLPMAMAIGGCDFRSDRKAQEEDRKAREEDRKAQEERARRAEQQAEVERQQRVAAEKAKAEALAAAIKERSAADRNYAIAIAAMFAGALMLVFGAVAGAAMGSKARRDLSRQQVDLTLPGPAPDSGSSPQLP